MASLMEELITVLRQEKEIYQNLIPVSEEKTKILVDADLKKLQDITEKEQGLLDQAYALGKQRESIFENVGVVLNRDPHELQLSELSKLLNNQPEESRQLKELHDSLKKIMKRVVTVNHRNKELIENSLEMIEFNMNFIQSTRMSPGSNNYNKDASSNYGNSVGSGAFDAKQ